MRRHWTLVTSFGDIYVNSSCATHVHVSSGSDVSWTVPQVKVVAQAIIYFENAFEAILPKFVGRNSGPRRTKRIISS